MTPALWMAAWVAFQACQLPVDNMLVLPLVSSDGAAPPETDAVGALLSDEVSRQMGRPVTSWLEVPPSIRDRAEGCADAPCAVQLGRLMAAAEVVVGKLNRVGSQQVLVLHRVRVSDGRVLGTSVTRVVNQDPAALLDALPGAVAELAGTPSRAVGFRARPMETEGVPRDFSPGYLGFEMEGGNHTATSDWGASAYPVEGPGKSRLSWGEFYRRVGRSDLADSLEQRAQIRLWLSWFSSAGSAVVLLGLGAAGLVGLGMLLFPVVTRNSGIQGVPSAFTQTGGPLWWSGLVLLSVASLVGVLLFVAEMSFPSPAMFLSVQPAGEAEIRGLAEDYNRSL